MANIKGVGPKNLACMCLIGRYANSVRIIDGKQRVNEKKADILYLLITMVFSHTS